MKARHACDGREQRCVVLHGHQPPYRAGQWHVPCYTEHGAEAPWRPASLTDGEQGRKIETEWYNPVLSRFADPEVEQLVSHLGTDSNQDIRVLSEKAFELYEGSLLRTGEVTL